MISRTDATTIIEAHLNGSNRSSTNGLRFVVTRVDERPASWVVYYDSDAHLMSREVQDKLAGNAPFVVLKTTGAFAPAAPASRLPEAIAEVESKLVEGSDSEALSNNRSSGP